MVFSIAHLQLEYTNRVAFIISDRDRYGEVRAYPWKLYLSLLGVNF
jgi:hypothetical protein